MRWADETPSVFLSSAVVTTPQVLLEVLCSEEPVPVEDFRALCEKCEGDLNALLKVRPDAPDVARG